MSQDEIENEDTVRGKKVPNTIRQVAEVVGV